MRCAAFAIVALLFGCGEGGFDPASPSGAGRTVKKGTIGILVLTLTNPFFKVVADTVTEEAVKHGYEVIVTSGEFDVARRQNRVSEPSSSPSSRTA